MNKEDAKRQAQSIFDIASQQKQQEMEAQFQREREQKERATEYARKQELRSEKMHAKLRETGVIEIFEQIRDNRSVIMAEEMVYEPIPDSEVEQNSGFFSLFSSKKKEVEYRQAKRVRPATVELGYIHRKEVERVYVKNRHSNLLPYDSTFEDAVDVTIKFNGGYGDYDYVVFEITENDKVYINEVIMAAGFDLITELGKAFAHPLRYVEPLQP